MFYLYKWLSDYVSIGYSANDFQEEINQEQCELLGKFSAKQIANMIKNKEYDFSDTQIPNEIKKFLSKRLTKKELNKLILTKEMSIIDYIVGIDSEGDYICVNYLDETWTDEPRYVLGTYGKDKHEGEHEPLMSFTSKKHLIDYLVDELEIVEED